MTNHPAVWPEGGGPVEKLAVLRMKFVVGPIFLNGVPPKICATRVTKSAVKVKESSGAMMLKFAKALYKTAVKLRSLFIVKSPKHVIMISVKLAVLLMKGTGVKLL